MIFNDTSPVRTPGSKGNSGVTTPYDSWKVPETFDNFTHARWSVSRIMGGMVSLMVLTHPFGTGGFSQASGFEYSYEWEGITTVTSADTAVIDASTTITGPRYTHTIWLRDE
jgi:hypothetical protein